MASPQRIPEPKSLTPLAAQLKRERLRFSNFRFARTPSGLCTAEVELEWLDGVSVVGRATGQSSPMGDLRVAAEAALHALENFAGGALAFELAGIKALRAFDANIVSLPAISPSVRYVRDIFVRYPPHAKGGSRADSTSCLSVLFTRREGGLECGEQRWLLLLLL